MIEESQSSHNINLEQAKAALRAEFSAAARDIFRIQMTGISARTADDYGTVEKRKSRLVNFAPELMDDRFAQEVKNLIAQCNEILDALIKGSL